MEKLISGTFTQKEIVYHEKTSSLVPSRDNIWNTGLTQLFLVEVVWNEDFKEAGKHITSANLTNQYGA